MSRNKTRYQENYGNENESYDETRIGSNFDFFSRDSIVIMTDIKNF